MTEIDEPSRSRKLQQLDRAALDALLNALAPDREEAGHKYEDLRRRLINLFSWERCESPNDLADEVLNRLAKRAHEGAVIPHMDRFAFGIARLVMQEDGRKRRNRDALLRELHMTGKVNVADSRALDAVESCLAALPEDRRQLIERYYVADRKALAEALGISLNALRNRAMRIRSELFNCVMQKRDDS